MAAVIPTKILGMRGQRVKRVANDEQTGLVFHCDRDRRFVPIEDRIGARGTTNQRLRCCVQDLPLWGQSITLSIEYCQLKIGAVDRRMERLDFVAPGMRYTRRFCRFVSQLAQHMSLSAVARYADVTWQATNTRLLGAAGEAGVERGTMWRLDSTVMDRPIHESSDSSQLRGGVRVMGRLLAAGQACQGDPIYPGQEQEEAAISQSDRDQASHARLS